MSQRQTIVNDSHKYLSLAAPMREPSHQTEQPVSEDLEVGNPTVAITT